VYDIVDECTIYTAIEGPESKSLL